MFKKRINYTDFNGVERSKDFWFNFTEAELMEMELTTVGGLSGMIQKIIDANDQPTIIKIFKKLVLDAYGEKSDDGESFIKSEENKRKFEQSAAYSVLFMELATNAEAGADFFKKVIPSDIAKNIPDELPKN